MSLISVDLGTTNIKVIVYDNNLKALSEKSANVEYIREGDIVEFNAEQYFDILSGLIKNCCDDASVSSTSPSTQIVLTGQAESLVFLGKDGKTVRNAISWLDMRSRKECDELRKVFSADTCYHITGQPEIIPTWPITKILWIKKHEPDTFDAVDKYLLLKDYIQYRLCGILAGEHSIYNFSHYFNIVKKEYWTDILDYVGIRIDQLPPTVPSCTVLGSITSQMANDLGLNPETKVNVGTLDHFAGMIGTGNIQEGIISESTGTVLALATMVNTPAFNDAMVPLHCGPFDGTYVFLPVCESGGISLEWFKKTFTPDDSFLDINKHCSKKKQPGKLVFLPYITGTNAPDFNADASGVFFGIKASDNKYDFALAVMEGVSHMLNTNIKHLKSAGVNADRIISTGGGANSQLWCQLKADITNYTVAVPENKEAACLGAAIIGAVSEQLFVNYEEAINRSVFIKKQYEPTHHEVYTKKSELYNMLYDKLLDVYKFHTKHTLNENNSFLPDTF